MRKRRLLLATSTLATLIGCGSDKKPIIYANPKGSHYDAGTPQATDAGAGSGSGSAAADAGEPVLPPPANPKGSFYDQGLTPKPGE